VIATDLSLAEKLMSSSFYDCSVHDTDFDVFEHRT
jgi:hypothetical protein